LPRNNIGAITAVAAIASNKKTVRPEPATVSRLARDTDSIVALD
jgi:hypothetical protein